LQLDAIIISLLRNSKALNKETDKIFYRLPTKLKLMRLSTTTFNLKHHLKTFLFNSHFPVPLIMQCSLRRRA